MIQWHFHEWGQTKQLSLVFLHGFMGTGADWQPIAQQLSHAYHCLAPDLPDHGETLANSYNFDTIADSLVQTLLAPKIQRTILIGYSLGGRLALYLLTKYPQYFSGCIIESAHPGLESAQAQSARRLSDFALGEKLKSQELSDFIDEWYAQPLFYRLKDHPNYPALKDKRENNQKSKLIRVLNQLSLANQTNLWPKLSQVQVPLLYIFGEEDLKYQQIAYALQASHPRIKIRGISQAGHNTHFEQTEDFLRAIQNFLKDLAQCP